MNTTLISIIFFYNITYFLRVFHDSILPQTFIDCELRAFDSFLKKKNKMLYKKMNKEFARKIIPYIWIWRKLNFNILKFS